VRRGPVGLAILAAAAALTIAPSTAASPSTLGPAPPNPPYRVLHYGVSSTSSRFTATLAYPAFDGAAGDAAINRVLRGFVERAGFEFGQTVNAARPEGSTTTPPSELTGTVEVTLATARLASVRFEVESYVAGAAHGSHQTTTFTFQRDSGRALHLADLFATDAGYLEVLARESRARLAKQPGFDPASVGTGLDPTEENFATWGLTRDALELTFDEYQVGPYAAGRFRVAIPYADVSDVLARPGPLDSVLPTGAQPPAPPQPAGDTRVDGLDWSERGQTAARPTGRTGDPITSGNLAYDAADKVTLYYQPQVVSADAAQTWTWDGGAWQRRQSGPVPGLFATSGMAYDADTSSVVLLGTAELDPPLSSTTWTWSKGSWTERPSAHRPAFRTGAAFAYDPGRRGVVLFGGTGVDGRALDDTWLWTGTDWTELHPGSPPPGQSGAAMAYDAARSSLVLFPRQDPTRLFELRGDNWLEWVPPIAPPEGGYWMLAQPDLGRLTLVGADSQRFRQWGGDGRFWLQRRSVHFPDITRFLATYDSGRHEIVLLGDHGVTWVGVDSRVDVPGCRSPDGDCDGLTDVDELWVGTNPLAPDSDGDGLRDAWETPASVRGRDIHGVGFSVDGATVARDDVLGPYDDDPISDNDVAGDGRMHGHATKFNHRPDPLRADSYVELDFQDCQQGGCPEVGVVPIDPLHHAPDMHAVADIVSMFGAAPYDDPDGSAGVHLNVLVDERMFHYPNCAQARDDSGLRRPPWQATSIVPGVGTIVYTNFGGFGTNAQRQRDRDEGTHIIDARTMAVRYVWSGHSSASADVSSCPVPSLGDLIGGGLPGSGTLPSYDYSPFGDAPIGGRTIVASMGIIWSCRVAAYGCIGSTLPGIFPVTKFEGHGDLEARWPVSLLLGFPAAPTATGLNDCLREKFHLADDADVMGAQQVWARGLAHLLGNSLGLEDADARNDPADAGLDTDGDGIPDHPRPPDSYARWSGLLLAPTGVGRLHEAHGVDFPRVQSRNPDHIGDGHGDGPGLAERCRGNPPMLARATTGLPPTSDRTLRATSRDRDGDGIGDVGEKLAGSNAANPRSRPEFVGYATTCTDGSDNDADGRADAADPTCQDRDRDGVPDSLDKCPSVRSWATTSLSLSVHDASIRDGRLTATVSVGPCAAGRVATARYDVVATGRSRGDVSAPEGAVTVAAGATSVAMTATVTGTCEDCALVVRLRSAKGLPILGDEAVALVTPPARSTSRTHPHHGGGVPIGYVVAAGVAVALAVGGVVLMRRRT
jgi:hypothetical protein